MEGEKYPEGKRSRRKERDKEKGRDVWRETEGGERKRRKRVRKGRREV